MAIVGIRTGIYDNLSTIIKSTRHLRRKGILEKRGMAFFLAFIVVRAALPRLFLGCGIRLAGGFTPVNDSAENNPPVVYAASLAPGSCR
jgi:hypothetical protein